MVYIAGSHMVDKLTEWVLPEYAEDSHWQLDPAQEPTLNIISNADFLNSKAITDEGLESHESW